MLSRVSGARKGHGGQLLARCTGHEDKSPSLSIRETPEGAVLLKCWAGCSVGEVVAGMGLELSDLFPPGDRPAGAPKRIAPLLTAMQALDLLHAEATLIAVLAANIGHGVPITSDEIQRALTAAGRIAVVREGATR